jgi:hypothetical protein
MSDSRSEKSPSLPGISGEQTQRQPNDSLPSFLEGLSASSREEWLELLQADQGRRWAQGQPSRVEEYLQRLPDAAGDEVTVRELLRNEIRLRRQREETPQLQEYLQRFPQHETLLRGLFPPDPVPGEEAPPAAPSQTLRTSPPGPAPGAPRTSRRGPRRATPGAPPGPPRIASTGP